MVHTMGGSLAGSDSWFNTPSSQVSSHYGVGLDGTCHQYVRLTDQAWVNGILEAGNRWAEVTRDHPFARGLNPNAVTVGIETADLADPQQPVTDAQYAAVRDVCRLSIAEQPSIVVLSSHHIVSPINRPGCAGRRWTNGRIQQLAADLGLRLVI